MLCEAGFEVRVLLRRQRPSQAVLIGFCAGRRELSRRLEEGGLTCG